METSDLEIVTWKVLVQMVLLALGMSGNSLGAQTLGPYPDALPTTALLPY